MNIICCSGGNDSVALIQWAHENNLKDVVILYNDTGWAIDWWPERMSEIKSLCNKYLFAYRETTCEGFKNMVRRKKGFPMGASPMQFCSGVLKKDPTLKWLKENDQLRGAIIYIGVRREESVNRKNHPYEIFGDTQYDGRIQRFPLVEYTEKDRDLLIDKTGVDILLHSSMECFPCVNTNKKDLRLLSKYPKRIQEIEDLEKELGFTSKGKPRVMFRPKKHMGATGIREVVKWGLSERGKYKPPHSVN